jgi:hypothetical protein
LEFVSVGADEAGYPRYEVSLPNGDDLILYRTNANTWELESNGVFNALYESASGKTDPTGLVFDETGPGTSQVTIRATNGTLAPKLGDRGKLLNGPWYRWDGTAWLPDFAEAISYAGNNPNIPENLTITGITTPASSDPLTLPRISDGNGFPQWELNSGEWSVFHSMGTWGVLGDGGAEYQALKASTDLTPIGLTGWTVSEGAGQPTITGDNPTGLYLGQLCLATDGTWWRWDGSEWIETLDLYSVQTITGEKTLNSFKEKASSKEPSASPEIISLTDGTIQTYELAAARLFQAPSAVAGKSFSLRLVETASAIQAVTLQAAASQSLKLPVGFANPFDLAADGETVINFVCYQDGVWHLSQPTPY